MYHKGNFYNKKRFFEKSFIRMMKLS